MPSEKKALAKVPPRELHEVDRLNKNPEKRMANAGQAVKQKSIAGSETGTEVNLSSLLFNLENIQCWKYTISYDTIMTLVCRCAVKKP